jgi:hypothetical protein
MIAIEHAMMSYVRRTNKKIYIQYIRDSVAIGTACLNYYKLLVSGKTDSVPGPGL